MNFPKNAETPPTAPDVPPTGAVGGSVAVLIPAFQPPPSLTALAQALSPAPNVGAIVIVDDGSGEPFRARFEEVARLAKVVVLTHAQNRGKGAALKTGLAHVAASMPNAAGVVTADADGQHAPADVLAVAERMAASGVLHLGVRSVGREAPLRSRFGNALTRDVLRLVTGLRLRDTQTGLRGIPLASVPALLRLPDDGYDYEMDMLVSCARNGWAVREVPIETIYIDGNRSSHFNPVLDSLRIYYVLLRYLISSLLAALVDNVLFVIAFGTTSSLLGAQIVGRIGGVSVNFWLNRNQVFHSHEPGGKALAKYLALVVASGTLSYWLIRGLVATGSSVLLSKIAAESLLFFLNFALQRTLIFKSEPGRSTPAR
jgi:putative flippase GtrA